MGTERISTTTSANRPEKDKTKWTIRSLINPQFDSDLIEKKYSLSCLKKIYPSSHRLLVIILVVHSIINLIERVVYHRLNDKTNLIHLILFGLTIVLNLLSVIFLRRQRIRFLSILISLIGLVPLTILSILYPSECHLYLLISLFYSLTHFPLMIALSCSLTTMFIAFILQWTFDQRLFLLFISHFIGIYLNRLIELTTRSAYDQLCKNAVVRCSLSTEHALISKMIDSLMPRKYARVIMQDIDVFRERVQNLNSSRINDDDLQMSSFRPLHIERMENVSILFADIVGFTHMSSNKTAAQLVNLLSDLYGRFDNLCAQMSCEKIATLGDCYYCVSGCPEPRQDHAKSCVLMGLAMINAIEEFDQDNNEQVDMRVGVHSGSVNCGIVGTKKFKFDIFSNDVTLANKMESTGKPGYVHITESTHKLLQSDEFQFEKGSDYTLPNKETIETYFIAKRQLSHRITTKTPETTLATAAAVAIASKGSLTVQLNETTVNSNPSETVTSPLLEDVERVRRATICEENPNVKFDEKTVEKEENELDVAFHFLTLKYRENNLEKGFSSHIGPHSLLIVEVLLSILSLILLYLYLPKKILLSIVLSIILLIKFLLTLILVRFYEKLLRWWICRHIISSIYLLSPLILILISLDYNEMLIPVFIIYLSTYLTIGASISHLIKTLFALLSICLFLPLFLFWGNYSMSTIVDLCLCLFISLVVLYGISRQVEIARRFQYHVVYKSSEQRQEMERERERADWLLRNILPEHVIQPLRVRGGNYSKNHPCVAVLFASLVNFHVMYEEQYEGGKFYARILNEFYGDIEELFLDPKFTKIEKIKTIGSTFMAASGLQNDSDDENNLECVSNLIDFALAFQLTMKKFNEALLNFEFELRMGLNFGPVTAGVIGTTKLFYDIWGDTVNVASRMDSTGEKGQIQVPEHLALALEDKYQFQYRGEIDVKGKSRMKTFFLKPK